MNRTPINLTLINRTLINRTLIALAALTAPALIPSPAAAQADRPEQPCRDGERLYGPDAIAPGLEHWRVELQDGGTVTATPGTLDVDVPNGATVWFEPELSAPVRIAYDVTAIDAGGPNDEVSDVNCFWMATDARAGGGGGGDAFFAVPRGGAFPDYNELRCYYVGLGGNRNTTTRFRRYVGDADDRPLLRENDLSGPADLIAPNAPTHVELVACDGLVQYWRDGRVVFQMHDPAPYLVGRFGFRTVKNHLRVENFSVHRLDPSAVGPIVEPYRQTPQGGLSLRTFRPAGWRAGDARPAVVLFHGGAWQRGTPSAMDDYARWLAGRGMVVVSPEYRVESRQGTTPVEALRDAFAAFRFVRANAAAMGIDPARLAAGGGSAGGQMAAALATADPAAFGDGDPAVDPRPDALVLFNPVYDNSPDGYGAERLGDRWRGFSPLANLNAAMPPTAVFLGDRDELVPVKTAEAFRDGQRALGVRSELAVFPGEHHGFFNRAKSVPGFTAVRRGTDAFFVSLGWLAPLKAGDGPATRPATLPAD